MTRNSLFTIFILLVFSSCIPEHGDMQASTIKIIASSQVIQNGGTISVSLNPPSGGSWYARWTCTPSNGVVIDSEFSRITNKISFSAPGNYTVHADLRSVSPYCIPNATNDSCFTSSQSEIPLDVPIRVVQ